MDKITELCKRNELKSLIYKLGEMTGEDVDFLNEYANDIAQRNKDDLDVAIQCFRDLIKQGELHGLYGRSKGSVR